jgi:hypothetical protein
MRSNDASFGLVFRESDSPATSQQASSMVNPSPGSQNSATDHATTENHGRHVGGVLDDQSDSVTSKRSLNLTDPLLSLAADIVDDLEKVRVANENRLRQLTRSEGDKDGQNRGWGLDLDHPDVARLAGLVDLLIAAEKQAIKNLEIHMKQHPLGPWVKLAKGVGEKQAARLLAAIGDPYWNELKNRPRRVAELRSYCGYGDAEKQVRRKGVKANWSADAKKRAYLVATSIIKAGGPYREVYDQARAKYDGAVHTSECRRCGPAGKPALPGSPLSAGHQHARGLRAICKAVLKDLWFEARSLHGVPDDQRYHDNHQAIVVGDSS